MAGTVESTRSGDGSVSLHDTISQFVIFPEVEQAGMCLALAMEGWTVGTCPGPTSLSRRG